jgi:hypothetical protein
MKAFPTNREEHCDGMDLRDYFAAKAMQSLSNNNDMEDLEDVYAAQAYRIADAMMKAREQC